MVFLLGAGLLLGNEFEKLDYPSSVRPFSGVYTMLTEDARDMRSGWELQIFARAARWYSNLFCRAVVGFR